MSATVRLVRVNAIRAFSVGVFGAVCASGADARHSRALYDMAQEVVLEGTVVDLNWSNPHIVLTVETKGADGGSCSAKSR